MATYYAVRSTSASGRSSDGDGDDAPRTRTFRLLPPDGRRRRSDRDALVDDLRWAWSVQLRSFHDDEHRRPSSLLGWLLSWFETETEKVPPPSFSFDALHPALRAVVSAGRRPRRRPVVVAGSDDVVVGVGRWVDLATGAVSRHDDDGDADDDLSRVRAAAAGPDVRIESRGGPTARAYERRDGRWRLASEVVPSPDERFAPASFVTDVAAVALRDAVVLAVSRADGSVGTAALRPGRVVARGGARARHEVSCVDARRADDSSLWLATAGRSYSAEGAFAVTLWRATAARDGRTNRVGTTLLFVSETEYDDDAPGTDVEVDGTRATVPAPLIQVRFSPSDGDERPRRVAALDGRGGATILDLVDDDAPVVRLRRESVRSRRAAQVEWRDADSLVVATEGGGVRVVGTDGVVVAERPPPPGASGVVASSARPDLHAVLLDDGTRGLPRTIDVVGPATVAWSLLARGRVAEALAAAERVPDDAALLDDCLTAAWEADPGPEGVARYLSRVADDARVVAVARNDACSSPRTVVALSDEALRRRPDDAELASRRRRTGTYAVLRRLRGVLRDDDDDRLRAFLRADLRATAADLADAGDAASLVVLTARHGDGDLPRDAASRTRLLDRFPPTTPPSDLAPLLPVADGDGGAPRFVVEGRRVGARGLAAYCARRSPADESWAWEDVATDDDDDEAEAVARDPSAAAAAWYAERAASDWYAARAATILDSTGDARAARELCDLGLERTTIEEARATLARARDVAHHLLALTVDGALPLHTTREELESAAPERLLPLVLGVDADADEVRRRIATYWVPLVEGPRRAVSWDAADARDAVLSYVRGRRGPGALAVRAAAARLVVDPVARCALAVEGIRAETTAALDVGAAWDAYETLPVRFDDDARADRLRTCLIASEIASRYRLGRAVDCRPLLDHDDDQHDDDRDALGERLAAAACDAVSRRAVEEDDGTATDASVRQLVSDLSELRRHVFPRLRDGLLVAERLAPALLCSGRFSLARELADADDDAARCVGTAALDFVRAAAARSATDGTRDATGLGDDDDLRAAAVCRATFRDSCPALDDVLREERRWLDAAERLRTMGADVDARTLRDSSSSTTEALEGLLGRNPAALLDDDARRPPLRVAVGAASTPGARATADRARGVVEVFSDDGETLLRVPLPAPRLAAAAATLGAGADLRRLEAIAASRAVDVGRYGTAAWLCWTATLDGRDDDGRWTRVAARLARADEWTDARSKRALRVAALTRLDADASTRSAEGARAFATLAERLEETEEEDEEEETEEEDEPTRGDASSDFLVFKAAGFFAGKAKRVADKVRKRGKGPRRVTSSTAAGVRNETSSTFAAVRRSSERDVVVARRLLTEAAAACAEIRHGPGPRSAPDEVSARVRRGVALLMDAEEKDEARKVVRDVRVVLDELLAASLERLAEETTPSPVAPDEDLVGRLRALGYGTHGARKAVAATRNGGLDAALRWAVARSDDADFDLPAVTRRDDDPGRVWQETASHLRAALSLTARVLDGEPLFVAPAIPRKTTIAARPNAESTASAVVSVRADEPPSSTTRSAVAARPRASSEPPSDATLDSTTTTTTTRPSVPATKTTTTTSLFSPAVAASATTKVPRPANRALPKTTNAAADPTTKTPPPRGATTTTTTTTTPKLRVPSRPRTVASAPRPPPPPPKEAVRAGTTAEDDAPGATSHLAKAPPPPPRRVVDVAKPPPPKAIAPRPPPPPPKNPPPSRDAGPVPAPPRPSAPPTPIAPRPPPPPRPTVSSAPPTVARPSPRPSPPADASTPRPPVVAAERPPPRRLPAAPSSPAARDELRARGERLRADAGPRALAAEERSRLLAEGRRVLEEARRRRDATTRPSETAPRPSETATSEKDAGVDDGRDFEDDDETKDAPRDRPTTAPRVPASSVRDDVVATTNDEDDDANDDDDADVDDGWDFDDEDDDEDDDETEETTNAPRTTTTTAARALRTSAPATSIRDEVVVTTNDDAGVDEGWNFEEEDSDDDDDDAPARTAAVDVDVVDDGWDFDDF